MMGNLAALAALTLYLAAQPAPVFPARVAAGPAEDYMPALSADGELMAFVSNRAGAPNIWLMKLAEGPLQLPRRLTSGTAGEKNPAFSPDGKWLAFVSSSTDAEGDLFLLSVTAALRGEGPPPAERLTDGATADRDPVFTADGKALIYSAADKTGGPPGLWRLNLKSRERERLTADGQNPAVSPDGRQVAFVAREGDGGGLALLDPRTGERRALLGDKGIALFPAFAGDERVVFTWYAEDSNNDGAITIDDRPALYALDLARPGAPPYPLTSTESYALFPAARGDMVYFTARENGAVDIVSLPLAGMAPPQESAAADIARARERERYYPNRPALGILAWRAALAARGEDGAAMERAGISLELSRVYEQAGLLREAETLARAVAEQFPSARREAGLASLRATLLFARRTGKSPGGLIERLAALEKEWAGVPEVAARARMETGSAHIRAGRAEKGLEALRAVAGDPGAAREIAAEAALRRNEVYERVGDRARLMAVYLEVIRSFPDQTAWTKRAVEKALELAVVPGDVDASTRNLTELAHEQAGLPELAAAALIRAGNLREGASDILAARALYREAARRAAEARGRGEALFALAQSHAAQEEFEQALAVYGEIERDTGPREEAYARARRESARQRLRLARFELARGEAAIALKTYSRLLAEDADMAAAHRGRVEALAALGRAKEAVAVYEKEISPAGRYALGLALTYLAPPDLARARAAVEEAVRANPGEPWFHQTLGWIYEQLERGESAEGFAERALMEYELALSLLEAEAPAERRADLYTNLGNVHYLLNDCPDAVARYRDRLATGLPFPVRAQESVVHQRLGECAYRLGDDRAAAGWFRRALELSGEGEAARRVELYERMGLAQQSAGEWAGAAENFTRALEMRRRAGLAADTAVTLRNIANNLHQGAAAGGPEGRENLYRALELYQLSAGELARSGKSAAAKEKNGALISVEVETGVGGAQLASRGFGEREERRLIHHQMGAIHSQLGGWAKAAEHFGQKLAASPDEPRLLANPAALMERAVAYNQLAFALAKSGQGARARDAYARALELCHKTQSAVCLAENAASLAALAFDSGDDAAGAVELAAPALEAARALGGADRLTMGLGWARLGALYMERALAPDTGGKDAVHNARALRAMGDGLYHAATSLELARGEFAAAPGTVSARADIKTVMRQGLLAQALGEAEKSAGLFEQAAALAEARLAPDLAWQSRALALIAGGGSPESVAHEIAAAPLAMLEDGDAAFAHALASEVYGRLAARALERNDAAAALAHIDAGMAARLRMSLGGLLAMEGAGVPGLAALIEMEKARAALAAEAAAGKEIAGRWTEWGKQYARAAEAAANENPVLGRLILSRPLDMAELQGYLDEGEALVTLFHSPAALIVVTAEGVRAAPAAGGIAEALAKAAPGARRIYLATDRPFSDLAADELAARYEVAAAPAPRLLPLFKEAQTVNDFRLLAFGFETAAWNPAHFGEVIAVKGLEAARRIDGGLLSSPGVAAFARGPVFGGAGELPRLSLGMENGAAVGQSIGAMVEANAGGAALVTPPPAGPDGARAAPGPWEGAALSLALLSGYATWIVTPDEQGARDVFIEAFTGGLDSGSLGESFAAARGAAKGGRLLGAFGLDAGARTEFARERFAELARAGARSIERGEHGKAARELSDALWYTRLAGISRYDEPILNRLAETEYRLGRYEEALAHQERLTKIHEAAGDTLKLAESLTLSGAMRNRLGRYGESARDYGRALALYQKLGQPGRMARALAGLGVAEEERQRYGEALSAFGRARELASRAGERDEAALGHGRIGRIHHLRQNDYARAREAYEAGLKLAEPGGAAWLELSFGLGAVETDAGRLERAAELFKEALARALAAKDREAAGRAEFHLGSVHWFRGEYGEAFSLLRSAQDRARAGGDTVQQAMIANTLGLVYWTLNDYPRALDALAASRELAKKAAAQLDEASALNNLGLVHRSMGEWDTALSYFEQAREIDLRLGSDWGLGYDARNMSIAWLLKGELDRAEAAAREAVEITGRIHDRINHAKALLQLAEAHAARGAWDKAGPRYEEAVRAAEEVWSPETLWRALRGRGLARKAGGDRTGAAAAYREAVEVVEGMRAGIRIEELKSGFLDDKQDMYEELILLLLDEGRTREAFLYAERARARGFVDLLGAARLDLGDKLAQGAYERILELSRRVEERAAEERSAPEKERQKSSRALVAARRALAEAVERARLDAPGALPFVTVEPVDLDKLFALLGEKTALLEYVAARGETVIFTVFNGEVSARRVKVERAELERLLGEYRALIQEGAPARERARELYKLLVEPAADIVARAEVVGIAPHRALHYLSFASLHDGEAYLIDRAPLFYLPAASVFGYAAARRGTAPKEEMRVLAVGNPDLGELNYDLPLAELEAKSIRWAIPSVDTLIGREATKRAATENIGRYQVVHIASHGEFDPVNPLMSALRLAPEPGETGALTAREVFGLRLAADLVIMSACQTGLGKVSAGDEVAGLNRAFLASGAHAVISTLWRVDDLASASLVKHFYRGYVDMDAAKALRAAQLTVKARQPHPRYWAGFILVGDYQ